MSLWQIVGTTSLCLLANNAKKRYYRDDEFLRQVGARIRAHRIANGMTQVELAFACEDKDYSQINRVELGKVNFSISYLSLIARNLGVAPQDLLPSTSDDEK